ncbi:MAG: RDD family protein [Syntrophales bacterium]
MTDRLYGGFWRRLFAYAVDKLILYAIAVLLLLVAIAALVLSGFSTHRIVAGGNPLKGIGPFFLLYLGALFIIDMLYFTWFHGSVGQTPGKMLLKLRVIRASGEEMTFGAAFLRWAGTYVSSLFLSLGYLWIALDGRKQGWHDKIAATLVIRTAEEPPPLTAPPAGAAPCPSTVGEPAPPVITPVPGSAAPPPEPASPADTGSAVPRNIP